MVLLMKNLRATSLRSVLLAALAFGFVFISGCATVSVGPAPQFEANAKWALLPFVNHTETPQAGLRAESIAENLFRAGSRAGLKHYPGNLNSETLFEPMDRKQSEAALEWARGENIRYALAGNVDEWRYKVGVDGEPAAGVTLQVIDVASGDVLWAATGGQTGWSREALSAVAQKLIAKLLNPVILNAR
jgi:TolB-like protein